MKLVNQKPVCEKTLSPLARSTPDLFALPTTPQVYRAYASLAQPLDAETGRKPGGQLLVAFSLSAESIAWAIAGCVAGLAVLLVEESAEGAKQMLRLGLSDFVVSDLTEALQILKNQIRKAQPVSVCLCAPLEPCAQAMAERGLQPEFMAGVLPTAATPLLARGAILLEAAGSQTPVQTERCVVWRLRSKQSSSGERLLAHVDRLSAQALSEQPKQHEETQNYGWRKRWLLRSPRYLGRTLGAEHCLCLQEPELERLSALVHDNPELDAQVELIAIANAGENLLEMNVQPSHKKIILIAGPNGAGKTTFARDFLLKEANLLCFINADLIAAGLSPFAPDKAAIRAGKLMLEEINRCVAAGESFAFETTLAGLSYAKHIQQWRSQGYRVDLYFLTLPDAETAIMRVTERVEQGGHSIPESDIRRRYMRGWQNFKKSYQAIVSSWMIYDNSGSFPVFTDQGENQ